MLYDNWIHKLSESYTNSNNINEEKSEHHPMVHKAADFIHSILDKHHGNHPKEKTLNSITRSLKGKEVTKDSVVDASHDAINDHYGLEGHSYEVNTEAGGDHSERGDYDKLLDLANDDVKDKLYGHLDNSGKKEVTEVRHFRQSFGARARTSGRNLTDKHGNHPDDVKFILKRTGLSQEQYDKMSKDEYKQFMRKQDDDDRKAEYKAGLDDSYIPTGSSLTEGGEIMANTIKHFSNAHGIDNTKLSTGVSKRLAIKAKSQGHSNHSPSDISDAIAAELDDHGAFDDQHAEDETSGEYMAHSYADPGIYRRARASRLERASDKIHAHMTGAGEKKQVKEHNELYEELSNAKEYANILENVLNTLLENDIITEEIIMEVLTGVEVYKSLRRQGNPEEEAKKAADKRIDRLLSIKKHRDMIAGHKNPMSDDEFKSKLMINKRIDQIDSMLKGTLDDPNAVLNPTSTEDRLKGGHVSWGTMIHPANRYIFNDVNPKDHAVEGRDNRTKMRKKLNQMRKWIKNRPA